MACARVAPSRSGEHGGLAIRGGVPQVPEATCQLAQYAPGDAASGRPSATGWDRACVGSGAALRTVIPMCTQTLLTCSTTPPLPGPGTTHHERSHNDERPGAAQ